MGSYPGSLSPIVIVGLAFTAMMLASWLWFRYLDRVLPIVQPKWTLRVRYKSGVVETFDCRDYFVTTTEKGVVTFRTKIFCELAGDFVPVMLKYREDTITWNT